MSATRNTPGHRAGWCVHYRALMHHDTCAAGVNYAQLRGDTRGPAINLLPCFIDKPGEPPKERVKCEHFRAPTPEEIAEHKAWFDARMNKMAVVFEVIMPWRAKHKGKSHAEVIDCPACKTGRLHLSIAASNGHVHGQCTTPDCVHWME